VKRRRPFGVTVIALLQALSGPIVGGSILGSDVALPVHGDRDLAARLAGLAAICVGLLIAVGLWRLQRWAWTAGMLWTGLGLAAALLAYLNGQPQYGIMAVGIAIVFYLHQRDVQRAFGQGTDPE
jgi:uncharacterized membrane protein (DUF2068 family)